MRTIRTILNCLHQGNWRCLVWLARWKIDPPIFDEYPPPAWGRAKCMKHDTTPQCIEITDVNVADLMCNLRRWKPAILAAAGDSPEHKAGELMHINSHLEWLQVLHDQLSEPKHFSGAHMHGNAHDGEAAGRDVDKAWNASMVAAHTMASHLSSLNRIGAIAASGVELLFPGMFTQAAQRRAGWHTSSSYLKKRRVVFDAALLVLQRQQTAETQLTRWAWADSSPQAGRDWFMVKEQSARDEDLPALAAAVDSLIYARGQSLLPHDPSLRQYHDTIQDCLHIAMKLPTAKGEGTSGLEHLAACYAHCNLMEAGDLKALAKCFDEHVSFTSDMGTDSGIRGFQIKNVRDILPSWLAAGAEVTARLGLDIDAGGGGHAGNDDAAGTSLRPLLDFAIEVPGALHILSNLPKDLDLRLEHWSSHMTKLSTFETLLGEKYHRERLQATCLRDCAESSVFDKFSGSLYQKRWFSVYAFVRESQPLIDVLVDKWSVEVYTAGFSKDKVDAKEDKKFSPQEVGRLLKDPMFHAYNHFVLAVGTVLKRLSAWVEGCPCHSHFVRELGKWKQRPVQWKAVSPRCCIHAVWSRAAAPQSWRPVPWRSAAERSR